MLAPYLMGEDCQALSGHTYLIDGSAVSWSMKRQKIVSLLTNKSEYITAMHAMKEGLWLCSLITQVFTPFSDATTLFSDNQSAIVLAKDHQYHAWTKHIDVHFHFIHWIVEEGKIQLIYCPTAEMVADTFTKLFHHPRSNTSPLNLASTMIEEECWRGNHPGVHWNFVPICLTSLTHYSYLSFCSCAHPQFVTYCTYYPHLTETSPLLQAV